jgi:hypothetical protein
VIETMIETLIDCIFLTLCALAVIAGILTIVGAVGLLWLFMVAIT